MGLAFGRAGSGPPLLLLHGLGHRRQAWDPVLGLLTPHREVITVDLPGHGASPPLRTGDGQNAVVAIADELGELLSTLGLARPHVAGNSLGGALALVLAARGQAASATALSPAGFPNRRYQIAYARGFFEFAVATSSALRNAAPRLTRGTAGRALLFGMLVARPGLLSAEQASGDVAGIIQTRPVIRAVFRTFTPFTAAIPDGVPVTVAWGAKDRLLSPANARVVRQRLPQARLMALPGCGHVPMTDDPELVARILLDGSSLA
ncbi:MAG TPA: alpha/beta fold hydrolase [Streptosporangiaceae bacterium]|nr:alpha/beta fold hydrolase [Streptosporangiaceae bacterium]